MPAKGPTSKRLLDTDSDSNGSGSDSDVDKEMLSLAKKKKVPPQKKVKATYTDDSDSSDSDLDWGSKSKGKKKKPKKVAAKRGSRRSMSGTRSSGSDDDDVDSTVPDSTTGHRKSSDLEEGEVSSSDSEDSSEDEFDDGFDENFVRDADDQQWLSSLTEIEREKVIFERSEKRESLKTRFDIEKKLKREKKKDLKRQKRQEQASSNKYKKDFKERSKERKKTVEGKVDKKSQAMDALKAKREAKKERAEEKEKQRQEQERRREELGGDDDDLKDDNISSLVEKSRKKFNASDIYSDDSDSDNDNEKKGRSSSSRSSNSSDSEAETSRVQPPQFVTNSSELLKICLSRDKLEKWLHYPFFERIVKGCYVRIGIGINNEHKSVYRIGEIVDVVETSKVYGLGKTRTNKGLRIRHGGNEKVFRIEFVSNSTFEESEFGKFMSSSMAGGNGLPTLKDIDSKLSELKEASEYSLNDAEIGQMVTEKQRFQQAPVNFAMRKTELLKEKEMAHQKGEESKVSELTRQLDELDQKASELDKLRTKTISSISFINERNRKKNVEEAEKAILEEHRANKGRRVEDPFTRRNTTPRIVHRRGNDDSNLTSFNNSSNVSADVSEVDGSVKSTNEFVNPNKLPALPALLNFDDASTSSSSSNNGTSADPKYKKCISTGDLFSAHDFEIKLDLDAKLPPTAMPIVARPSPIVLSDPASRRAMNLEDYKRKRGLI